MSNSNANLSNCYTPLPISYCKPTNVGGKDSDTFDDKTQTISRLERDSGSNDNHHDTKPRNATALRPLVLDTGVMNQATGSAMCEMGNTKVIAKVYGPVTASSELISSNVQLNMEEGVLHITVNYIEQVAYPTSLVLTRMMTPLDSGGSNWTGGKVNQWISQRETYLASRLLHALAEAVPLRQYPKCAILLQLTVLRDDGSILPACVTAASLALTDAAVEMNDLVTATTVACVLDSQSPPTMQYWADPTLQEEQTAHATLTLAFNTKKEVTLWEQVGRLTPAQVNEAMQVCYLGHRTLHKFIREHFIQKYQNEKVLQG
jgi:exosome complex component MTR3